MTVLPRRLFLPLFLPFCLVFRVAEARDQASSLASSIPRAGAARALRLVDPNGRALQGSFTQAHWEERSGGLIFTRDWGGTRNIWRAAPDERDKGRYPAWHAQAITQFEAPQFAADPSPMPGGRSLLCTSNATNPGAPAQIVQFELSNRSLRAVTALSGGASEVAPSPNGRQMAFTSSGSGISAVYVQSLEGGSARRIAINARHAAWQDNGTLLVESAGTNGIFRLSLKDLSHPVPLTRGGQASASSDGQLIAVTSNSDAVAESQRLYVLAGDGSGLRALSGTEGARGPAIAPDGSVLAYDAPGGGSAANRILWIVPLEDDVAQPVIEADAPRGETIPTDTRVNATTTDHRQVVDNPLVPEDVPAPDAPVAVPTVVSPPKIRLDAPKAMIVGTKGAAHGGVTILGTIQGEAVVPTLEVGQGAEPAQWSGLPVAAPPVKNGAIATWFPPIKARGVWTLRLSVSNAGGAAQSFFTLRLSSDAAIPTPISSSSESGLPAGGPLPPAPLPNLPAPPLPSLPLPAPLPTPKPTPKTKPTPVPTPVLPPQPRPTGQPLPPRFPAPTPTPTQRPLPPVPVLPAPRPLPPAPSYSGRSPIVDTGTGQDGATFNVSGTLATVSPGQSIPSTFWALNKGNRAWDSGRNGQPAGAVRLVARWVDFDSGNRKKWVLFWMKQAVAPGQRTNWSFNLSAPSKPGRYKLIYGLVRVPGNDWQPPAYNAPQVSWPGEFAAIAFAVDVK